MFEAFAQSLRGQDLAEATVRGYLQDLADFRRWFEHTNGEPLTLEAVTLQDVREYRAWLQRRHAAATVNRRLLALRKWLDWAVQAGHIQANPARNVRLVREQSPGVRWLDRKAVYALRRAAERILQTSRIRYPKRWLILERDALLTLFLLNTGLRVGEVVALTWGDVELRPRSGHVVVRQGKGGKQRRVPLNAEARKALTRWREALQKAGVSAETVWCDARGNRLTPRAVQRAVARVAREAGLEGVTPHVLRHTFGKTLARASGIEFAAAVLGHASLDTTRRYVEPSAQDLARAVEEAVL